MDDLISRQTAISAICNACGKIDCDKMDKCEKLQLPPANSSEFPNNSDTISRQAAIDEIKEIYEWHDNVTKERIIEHFVRLPSVQPEKRTEERTETHACDLIDREAAVDAIYHHLPSVSRTRARTMLHEVPSAQPERTCVNCGRTVNNGGWYADGRTRCPIEEHYALPKDGYCHLWEKRNVTDDDYPERREE